MAKFRKKPVVIEAFRLDYDVMPDWFEDEAFRDDGKVLLHDELDGLHADIYTLEGWHYAKAGDYIIRGVKGELYPCKADIFEMTYEKVEET